MRHSFELHPYFDGSGLPGVSGHGLLCVCAGARNIRRKTTDDNYNFCRNSSIFFSLFRNENINKPKNKKDFFLKKENRSYELRRRRVTCAI